MVRKSKREGKWYRFIFPQKFINNAFDIALPANGDGQYAENQKGTFTRWSLTGAHIFVCVYKWMLRFKNDLYVTDEPSY